MGMMLELSVAKLGITNRGNEKEMKRDVCRCQLVDEEVFAAVRSPAIPFPTSRKVN